MRAVEADEVRAAERSDAAQLAVALLEEDDVLCPAGPERTDSSNRTEHPAVPHAGVARR